MLFLGKGSKIYETAKVINDDNHEIIIYENCFVGDYVFCGARRLIMDNGSQISPHAIIGGGGIVRLGKFSTVGFGAKLISATHVTSNKYLCESAPKELQTIIRGSINLGEGAYIGAGAVVCITEKNPHIKIGDFAVIGSLSFIDKNVENYEVVYPKQTLVRKRRNMIND